MQIKQAERKPYTQRQIALNNQTVELVSITDFKVGQNAELAPSYPISILTKNMTKKLKISLYPPSKSQPKLKQEQKHNEKDKEKKQKPQADQPPKPPQNYISLQLQFYKDRSKQSSQTNSYFCYICINYLKGLWVAGLSDKSFDQAYKAGILPTANIKFRGYYVIVDQSGVIYVTSKSTIQVPDRTFWDFRMRNETNNTVQINGYRTEGVTYFKQRKNTPQTIGPHQEIDLQFYSQVLDDVSTEGGGLEIMIEGEEGEVADDDYFYFKGTNLGLSDEDFNKAQEAAIDPKEKILNREKAGKGLNGARIRTNMNNFKGAIVIQRYK